MCGSEHGPYYFSIAVYVNVPYKDSDKSKFVSDVRFKGEPRTPVLINPIHYRAAMRTTRDTHNLAMSGHTDLFGILFSVNM